MFVVFFFFSPFLSRVIFAPEREEEVLLEGLSLFKTVPSAEQTQRLICSPLI